MSRRSPKKQSDRGPGPARGPARRRLEKGTSKDGHDQMPLRKVLYRHRNDVYDLPARVQRRGLSHSPCEGEPLLWHAHRSDRVKWARIHKHGAAEVCGFVV